MKLLMVLGIVLAGGMAGFGWAKLVGCRDGACPLTATPWRGAAFGLVFGLVLALNALPLRGAAPGAAVAEGATILYPKDATAFAERIATGSGKTVLVDFYADWCGPCRRLAPELARFAEAHKDKVLVVKINVDQHAELARKYGVTGIPDIRLFRDGKPVAQRTGGMTADELAAWVQSTAKAE